MDEWGDVGYVRGVGGGAGGMCHLDKGGQVEKLECGSRRGGRSLVFAG